MFRLDRLLVSITSGANFRRGLELCGDEDGTLVWGDDSIGCGGTRALLLEEVTPMRSRDVSLISSLDAPFRDDLDELSTGCGSARRGLIGLVGLLGGFPERPSSEATDLRLLLWVSSIGCGRGLRGEGGGCEAMAGLSAGLDIKVDVTEGVSMVVEVLSWREAVRTATSGAIMLPQSIERGDWRSPWRPRHTLQCLKNQGTGKY